MRLTAIRIVVCAVCALATSGCGRNEVGTGRLAPMAAQVAPTTPAARKVRTLAYEHTVRIELSKEQLPLRMREVQTACTTNENLGCTLLDVSFSASEVAPSGSMTMRLAPSGVDPILQIAAKEGKVASRTTHAEDLAEPVADTERQLAQLSTHRDRLTELMKSKDIKIDQLIVASKELASVQSQIDTLSTQRANLQRRVDTELLTLNFDLPPHAYDAELSPVRDALRSFGSNLREGIASVISFVAILLPWLVIIVPGVFFLRLLWRVTGRWLARRHSS
jgi:hypothetical protein